MARSLLSLGSNLGNRTEQLAAARRAIAQHPDNRMLRESSVLENRAILYEEQPDFLNQIVEIETALTPLDLLAFLQKLEKSLGRIPRFKNGPREIDLDILTYDQLELNLPTLTLPHPGLADRDFLHRLLAEFELPAKSETKIESR